MANEGTTRKRNKVPAKDVDPIDLVFLLRCIERSPCPGRWRDTTCGTDYLAMLSGAAAPAAERSPAARPRRTHRTGGTAACRTDDTQMNHQAEPRKGTQHQETRLANPVGTGGRGRC